MTGMHDIKILIESLKTNPMDALGWLALADAMLDACMEDEWSKCFDMSERQVRQVGHWIRSKACLSVSRARSSSRK